MTSKLQHETWPQLHAAHLPGLRQKSLLMCMMRPVDRELGEADVAQVSWPFDEQLGGFLILIRFEKLPGQTW